MSSKSKLPYEQRAKLTKIPLLQKLFTIAATKKTNVVVSADLTTTKDLLALADQIGPYIAVFKTHIDIVSDFSNETVQGLKQISEKHNFLLFEDRKFVDIGNTVQMQYHGGALRISEFAHFVNATVLPGPDIISALRKTTETPDFPYKDDRGMLILAEMTTAGSLATGEYTKACVDIARKNVGFVVGFIALSALDHVAPESEQNDEEDFAVFTTGVNRASAGDSLGQQYKTPTKAVTGGADFIIAGRGIYAANDPVESVQLYQKEGWEAYLKRLS